MGVYEFLLKITRRFREGRRQPLNSFRRDCTSDTDRNDESDFVRLKNLTNYAKTSGSSYSAHDYEFGYHEMRFGNRILPGRRSPAKRIRNR